jgi:hypothetical protein
MRLIALAAIALAGCATTPARAPATCPTPTMSWNPRPWPTLAKPRPKFPCVRPVPTEGADRLRDGHDLDEALHCVERYYRGPDGLPIDAMLKGALDALVRQYPDARRAAIRAILDDVDSVPALTRTLLRVALLTRAAVAGVDVPPEDVLLKGALSALTWPTEILRPPFGPYDEKKTESYTAIAKDFLVYVKVGNYGDGVAVRFRRELALHPLSGVILDLRGSPGGLFDEAFGIADLFTRNGCLVVTRPPQLLNHPAARDQPFDVDVPMVVLVDRGTSSGSELIAATLRALGRAVIIGDKTEGKAIIQTLVALSSGTYLKLATAEMLAGDATPIHQRGVEPDVTLPASFEPDRGADRAIDFAKAVLRHTSGGRRDDLLKTARAIQ